MKRYTFLLAWTFVCPIFVGACAGIDQPVATVAAPGVEAVETMATLGANEAAISAVIQTPETEAEAEDRRANADVLYVVARQEAGGTWHFSVTVTHPDTGWEDYADGWDVVLPDGTVARPDDDSPFTRLLLHPHENEQPFTRGQGGIAIPQGVELVLVRAHDLVDGFGGREVVVDLTSERGQDFEIQR